MFATIKKHGLLLAFYAIVITALVSLTYSLTADTIARQQQQQLQTTLDQVIPATQYDNVLFGSCILLPADDALNMPELTAYLATKNEVPSAIAIETTAPNGYNGAIHLLIGLDMQGKILGTRVLTHAETPGLGDKIERRKSDWIDSFIGKFVSQDNLPTWAVRKDGGEFDQFTGATITPRAVVNQVKETALYFQANQATILSNPIACEG